ncbi:MAG: glycosyltransferase [Christensenellales bacterium]|jgi:glycosyltransferase EpsF
MAAQRVLHVISSTMRAGVTIMVMNMYRAVDREKVQFDFIAHDLGDDDFGPEIEALGGRVFCLPFLSRAGMSGYVRLVRDILQKNGPYAAVHAHTEYQAGFVALAAHQAGVPVRICHAHADTRYVHSPLFLLKKMLGRALIERYTTQRYAASTSAALSTFGARAVKAGQVLIVPNRIDVSAFGDRTPESRANLSAACNAAPDSRILGCVGRLSAEKNPGFVLDIAAAAKQAGMGMRFAFAGTGNMLESLTERRSRMGLEDTVFFLGSRGDIPSLMPCFDLLLVPSYTEGFCLAALEAQAAGTPVLASTGVPPEADMGLGLFFTLPLSAGTDAWAQKAADIIRTAAPPDIKTRRQVIRMRGHDTSTDANGLLRLYGIS